MSCSVRCRHARLQAQSQIRRDETVLDEIINRAAFATSYSAAESSSPLLLDQDYSPVCV